MDEQELRSRLSAAGLVASTCGNGPFDRYDEHRHARDVAGWEISET
jgi:hypothetical protein